MAILHQAQITPTKIELLSAWLPTQEWFVGDADAEFTNIAAYRFDDPAGEVGVETVLVRAGDGPTMHVPLTYRGAPLPGDDASLICTMQHSALGARWVYDGTKDPVYLQTVATAALNGGHQADLIVEGEQGRVERSPNALVTGSGTATAELEAPSVADIQTHQNGSITTVKAAPLRLRIQRVIGGDPLPDGDSRGDDPLTVGVLLATWTDSDVPQELVRVSLV